VAEPLGDSRAAAAAAPVCRCGRGKAEAYEEPFSVDLPGRRTVESAQEVEQVQKPQELSQDLAVSAKPATEVLREDSDTHTEKCEKPQDADADAVAEKCDKCDGPHPTDACPHLKKAREKHKDAWVNYGTKHIKQMGSSGGNFVLRNARCVPQPVQSARSQAKRV